MKKWSSPSAKVERFAASEYVAACGDLNRVYLFDCNAGDPEKRYDVKTQDGTLLTKDNPMSMKFFHPCHAVHEAPVSDEFIPGVMYDNDGKDRYIQVSESGDVMIWIDAAQEVHCTFNLDMNTWETTRS